MATWDKKSFCLITGASQGIGREIAIQFSQKVSPDSTLILSARSEKGLTETANLISKVQPRITTKLFPYDMSKPRVDDFKNLLSNYSSSDWDLYILVHNAGSEGSGRPLKDCENSDEWLNYLGFNICSMATLTSAFLKTFERDSKTIIVNITSLAAIKAIAGLGEYGVGKAAREMYLQYLSTENPELRILSYSPGPVNTAMVDRCIEKIQNSESNNLFETMRKERTLVKPEDTVNKLVSIVGAGLPPYLRVDYFDK